LRVLSAGINTVQGERADPLAIEAMRQVNVDISTHRTRELTFGMLDSADWIFTMTRAQRDCILALMPSCQDRVQLLSKREEDIPDPHSSSLELYRQTRDRIASCLREVVRVLGGRGA
jgi:protein-tyrosine-phosphatase